MPVRGSVVTSAVVAVAMLTLAACSPEPQQPGMAILDRAASAEDEVPVFVDLKGTDPSTVRLAADHGGFRFYLARPDQKAGFCLIQVADEGKDRWGSACATDGGPVLTTNLLGYGSEAAVVADGGDTGDLVGQGYALIQVNILVRR